MNSSEIPYDNVNIANNNNPLITLEEFNICIYKCLNDLEKNPYSCSTNNINEYISISHDAYVDDGHGANPDRWIIQFNKERYPYIIKKLDYDTFKIILQKLNYFI